MRAVSHFERGRRNAKPGGCTGGVWRVGEPFGAPADDGVDRC
jgi:hypothetical protein